MQARVTSGDGERRPNRALGSGTTTYGSSDAMSGSPSDCVKLVSLWYHGSVVVLHSSVSWPSQSTSMSAFQK